MLAEQLFDGGDGGVGALHQRVAFARIEDCRRQHIGKPHGAVVAQQDHPGVEHARHTCGKQAGAGDHVEAEAAVMRDGGPCRRGTLAANHLRMPLAHIEQDHWHVAARSIEVGLDDLERERGRAGGVEGVAAFFQHRHAHRRCDPMGRRHDPERALDFGPRGEGIGIDVAHGIRPEIFASRRDYSTGSRAAPAAGGGKGLLRVIKCSLPHIFVRISP